MARPDARLRKAVERLQYCYIHAVPFYREDGQEVVVDIQNKVNGVLEEPFALAVEIAGDGLRIRRSGLEWTEQEELTPGILIPSDKEYKARVKAEIASTPYLEDKFTVLDNPDPQMGQLYSYEEIVKLPIHRVWTVIEGDSGQLYASPGCHFVNRLHYIVTKEEWTEEDVDYKW